MFGDVQRRVIRVFIASPGDVGAERQIARETADELNRTLGRELGFHIDLLGWEDTLPGVGRPQGLINRDVDACDLFIGILWKRWGSPSGPDFTSGFEEEFDRAQKRHSETGEPEIWLSFKKVDETLLADPGEQLRRVVAFKQAQVAARVVLFKEFLDEEDWRRQLRAWLTTHIAQWVKREILAQITAGETDLNVRPEGATASARTPFDTEVPQAIAIPEQLRDAGTLLREVMTVGNDEEYAHAMDSLGRFELVRLHLFTKAWLSLRETSELLSSHEIHLLYRDRAVVEFAYPENQLVLRTILGDRSSVEAGWYWFPAFEPGELVPYLVDLATTDSLAEVRQSVLELMEVCNIIPEGEDALQFATRVLYDADDTVRRSALKYVAVTGDAKMLPLLDGIAASDGPVAYTAKMEAFRLRARINPASALTNVPRAYDNLDKEYIRILAEHLSSVPLARLRQAAVNVLDRGVRREVVRELYNRKQLNSTLANQLLEDSSYKVRELALRALIQAGISVTTSSIRNRLTRPTENAGTALQLAFSDDNVELDSVVGALFELTPTDQIEAEIDWFEIDGANAYRVWARRLAPTETERIRDDLSTDFARLREESEHRLEARYGPAAARLKESLRKYDSLFLLRFRVAALQALILSGTHPEDLPLLRQILASSIKWQTELRVAAIRGLKQVGSAEDVPQLIQIGEDSYGAVQMEALLAAITLAPGISGVATQLLQSDNAQFIRAGLKALRTEDTAQVRELVFPLLSHSNIDIRRLAVGFFIFTYSGDEIESILEQYLAQDTYYYNVVCWIDRSIYAPSELRDGYITRLVDETRERNRNLSGNI